MTTDASPLDRNLRQMLQDLTLGVVGRDKLAEWLSHHSRRLLQGTPTERGIIGDLYAALGDSEELHTDRNVREAASFILEQLGVLQLRISALPEPLTSTLILLAEETTGTLTTTKVVSFA